MIEVKNHRIYFYNMNKRDIIPVDFQCVSAYLCPHCKKVLAAYYGGKIVDLETFMEDPALKYHYTLGASNGGQYLLLDDHNHKKGCLGWEIVSLSARSITYSIDVWARRYEVGPLSLKRSLPTLRIPTPCNTMRAPTARRRGIKRRKSAIYARARFFLINQ